MRNVLTRTPVGTRLFIEQSCLFNLSEQIWWTKVVRVIQICFSCSILCTDGLLLRLVGKRQLLVYLGASYGNGKLGDSIWESHHKISAQGNHSSSVNKNSESLWLSNWGSAQDADMQWGQRRS